MKCPNCGEEVRDEAKFCPKCGTRLAGEAPAENPSSETVENKEEAASAEVVTETVVEAVEAKAEEATPAEVVTETVVEAVEAKAEEAAPAEVVTETVVEAVEAKAEEAAPVETVEAETVQPAPAATESSAAAAPAKQPLTKSKKILIGVAAALAVILVVCLANAQVIGNSVRKLFLSPEKYMAYVVADNGEEVIDVITRYYNDYILEHSNVSKTSSTATAAIEFGKAGKKLFEEADIKPLDKASVAFESAVAKGNASLKGSVSVNGKDITESQFVFDGNYFYFKMPGDSKYLQFSLDDLGMGYLTGYYLEDESTADAMNSYEKVFKALPDDGKVRKLGTKYIKEMVSAIDGVDRYTDEIKAGSVIQKVTVLELENYEKTGAEMALAAAKMAVDDKDLKAILKDVYVAAQEAAEDEFDMDFDEFYDEFVEALQSTIEDMEDSIEYLEDVDAELKLYVNSKGEIIGVEVESESWYSTDTYYYKVAHKGKNIGFVAGMKSDREVVYEIVGNGTDSKGVITADVKLKDDSGDGIKFKVEKFDYNAFKKGNIKGALIYDDLADLYRSVYYTDLSSVSDLTKAELKFSFDVKGSAYSFGLDVSKEKDKYFTISLDGKISHSASVSVPSSGKCIPCSDSNDILEYLQDYDYKPIINNLRKAGVDTELVDIIEEGLEDAMDELFY